MTVTVTRSRLLSLLAASVRTTFPGGTPLTRLTADLIKARMGVKDEATLVGSMSGGDETYTSTVWEVPGIGRAGLMIKRTTLGELTPRPEPPRRPTLFDP